MTTSLNPQKDQFVCPTLEELQRMLDSGQLNPELYLLYRNHCYPGTTPNPNPS